MLSMPSIVEFRRAEWTVNSISLLRYTAKTYSQMTGKWQQNNVFFLMWDTWKNYKPRSQVFHVSHIREISLICCHSAVCGAHFLHWNQNPKFWVTWHISETETNWSLSHLKVFAVLVTGLVVVLVMYIVILLCKSI